MCGEKQSVIKVRPILFQKSVPFSVYASTLNEMTLSGIAETGHCGNSYISKRSYSAVTRKKLLNVNQDWLLTAGQIYCLRPA